MTVHFWYSDWDIHFTSVWWDDFWSSSNISSNAKVTRQATDHCIVVLGNCSVPNQGLVINLTHVFPHIIIFKTYLQSSNRGRSYLKAWFSYTLFQERRMLELLQTSTCKSSTIFPLYFIVLTDEATNCVALS